MGATTSMSLHEMHDFIWSRLKTLSEAEPRFLRNQLDEYRRRGVVRLLSLVPMIASLAVQRRRDFVFFGIQYGNIIESLGHEKVGLIGGLGASRLARQKGFQFFPTVSAAFLLWLDYKLKQRAFLHIAQLSLRAYFKRVQPKFLILAHDLLPIDRLLVIAAKQCGVHVIVIAHGLYQSKSPPSIIDGQVADAVLVYDSHQSEIFRKAGVRKSVVMGFHSDIVRRNMAGETCEVCFIGQPWEKHYGPTLGALYQEILRNFAQNLQSLGVTVYYKPHPLEYGELDKYLLEPVQVYRDSLSNAFDKFDYFFSVASTALFEATLAGKVAVQLYHADFNCDDFAEFGYAHKIDALDAGALMHYEKLRPIVAPVLHYQAAIERFTAAIEQVADSFNN